MKAPFFLMAVPHGAKRISAGLVLAVAMTFVQQDATAATPTVDLGTASSFAILSGSQITDVPFSSLIVSGNVGLSPATGASIGLTAGQVGGTIYAVDAFGPLGSVNNPALLTSAKNDLTTAYVDAAGRSVPGANAFGVTDNQLGGKTLFPGVYSFGHAATANLIGTLTLDANGDPNPVWIFQASSDLITATSSKVALINGASSCDVFWQVGSSATIGTYSAFAGNIMADQSIALQAYSTLDGSALARIAAVTLDHNTITKPDCTAFGGGGDVPDAGSTLLLLSSGLAALLAFKRRFCSPA